MNTLTHTAFVEQLSDEFVNQAGVGVYAFLTHYEIKQVFNQYINQTNSLNKFIRFYVKQLVK